MCGGKMRSEPTSGLRYFVRISRHDAESYGWEICRAEDSIELHRSTRLFATRLEAILDSVSAAATLNCPLQLSLVDGEDGSGN